MPYNNTPIAPPKEATGQVSLPLARVKKIIHADDDIMNCSNNAAFVVTLATEMFVQYLVEQTHTVAKTEKKPRRNLQYKDVASAVARVDNLEFLSDVVPKTMTFKKLKEQRNKDSKSAKKGAASNNKAVNEEDEEEATPNEDSPKEDEPEASETEDREDDSGDSMEVDENDPEDKTYRGSARTAEEPVQMEMEIRGSRTSTRLSRGRTSLNGKANGGGDDE